MNKLALLAAGLVLIVGGGIFTVRFLSGEDDWICQNNQWVKHGNPSAPKPNTPCGTSIYDKGILEGSLSYPGEIIPKDMEVCAENIETKDLVCTKEQFSDTKYTLGTGYKIELKGGKYYIYATVLSDPKKYKAYYSEFVTCGLKTECESHKPIEITVEIGKTVSKIDPQDWYAN